MTNHNITTLRRKYLTDRKELMLALVEKREPRIVGLRNIKKYLEQHHDLIFSSEYIRRQLVKGQVEKVDKRYKMNKADIVKHFVT